MRIIAIKEMSVGNESVGEMWKETKIFNPEDTLETVMKWINDDNKKNIILSIANCDYNT